MLTLVASGTVSDYSDSDKSGLQENIAAIAGVDKSFVTIDVAAGSVRITATIAVPTSTTAAAVAASLRSSIGTAAAASEALGVEVTSEQEPTGRGAITVLAPPSLPPPLGPPPTPPALPQFKDISDDLSDVTSDTSNDLVGALAGALAGA